jgi:hypothetical protein
VSKVCKGEGDPEMGGIGEAIGGLSQLLGCLVFIGLPVICGVGILIGWMIWG